MKLESDREVLVAFEPTAAQFKLHAGARITLQWDGSAEDGIVALDSGHLVVHAPTGGFTRAWDDAAGTEIYVGPESGPGAR